MRRILSAGMALLLLTGCGTQEQTGMGLGAVGGGVLGVLAGRAIGGRNNGTAMALGGLSGAMLGAFAGGAIGRALDQRDQQIALQAQYAVLNRPVYYDPNSYQPGYGYTVVPPPRNPPPPQTYAANPTAARPLPASSSRPNRPTPRVVEAEGSPTQTWASDHNQTVHGSATVIAVDPHASSTGGECRMVRGIATIDGKEVNQQTRQCQGAGNQWSSNNVWISGPVELAGL